MKKFMVVEICERQISSVTCCSDMKEAIERANELLLERAENCGTQIDIEDYQNCEGYNEEWCCAKYDPETEKAIETNAWANWRSEPWDTQIVEFKVYGGISPEHIY